MTSILNYLLGKISQLYMNKKDRYDDEYYINNHLRHLNSFYGFMIRSYYKYIAKHCMITPSRLRKKAKILDVGCGVGILVREFNKLGYNAIGIDVNKSAINNSICPEKCFLIKSCSKLNYPENYFDLIVSREVLEHIQPSEIDNCIREWDRIGKGVMIHIIAVCERGASAIDDPTHVNVKTEKWWINKFKKNGYKTIKNPTRLFFSQFGNSGYLMMKKKT